MTRSVTPIATWAIDIGGVMLTFVGDILQLEVEALTCYASTSLTLHSTLAQRLIERGGSSIRAEGAKHAPAKVGEAVVLPGGRLSSRYIIAAVTNELRVQPALADIATCTSNVLRSAASLNLQSLAIPLLRIGRQITPEDIVRATLAPVIDQLCGNTSFRQVFIALSNEQEPAFLLQLAHFAHKIIDQLLELGNRRAAIHSLGATRHLLERTQHTPPVLIEELLLTELALQQQVQDLLEQALVNDSSGPGAMKLELMRCREAIRELVYAIAIQSSSGQQARAFGA